MTEKEVERAHELQGRRAGFVSRATSGVIVVAVGLGIYFAIVVGWGFVKFLASSQSRAKFEVPHPSQGLSVTAVTLIVIVLLAVSWSASGRSFGDSLLGLRVVTERGHRLGVVRAFVRALVLVSFAVPCMAWILVSRKNAGLHDLLCRTTVVYDWKPRRARAEAARPSGTPAAAGLKSDKTGKI
jgi:uncharacterized RDD family membrane protein YckC